MTPDFDADEFDADALDGSDLDPEARGVEPLDLDCPYCGEPITVLVDASAGDQRYVEDCSVCCRPIEIAVDVDADGDVTVSARTDRD